MTQQVRKGYRNHRKAAWGLALLLVAAIAAVAIPFASGASSKTLAFVTQPANPWQKNTTITPPIAVAVLSDGTPVNQGGTPSISATGAGTSSDFDFGSPEYNSSTKSWSWPNAKPKSTAPSGLYNLVATLGSLTASSNTFRVADKVCQAGQPCSAQSNNDQSAKGTAKVSLTNPFSNAIALDFHPGGSDLTDPKCDHWNRASYTDASGNTVYFPAIVLNYPVEDDMLQVTYMIRNSEWVQTDASRGNQDVDFCFGAEHSFDTFKNGDPTTNPLAEPFLTKSGDDAKWNDADHLFWGVLASVPNPSHVTNDPVVCARGTVNLPTGPGGTSETWRTWTTCVPFDWDWTQKGG